MSILLRPCRKSCRLVVHVLCCVVLCVVLCAVVCVYVCIRGVYAACMYGICTQESGIVGATKVVDLISNLIALLDPAAMTAAYEPPMFQAAAPFGGALQRLE